MRFAAPTDTLSVWHTERLVVREYGARDLRAKPDIARREFRVLCALHAAHLPVPQPHSVEAGVLVTGFMDGQPEFGPALGAEDACQVAAFLAHLHAMSASGFRFLPLLARPSPWPRLPDDALSESRIRAALDRLKPPSPAKPVVLHGDIWPGNILWSGGRLTAVLDWEDAARGDPLADIGNARLELLFFLGAEAMHAFTDRDAVLSGADMTALPSWDLRAALRPCGRLGEWGLEEGLERQMRRRHRAFVDGALRQLQRP